MNALVKMRAAIGMFLLVPSLAVASGAETSLPESTPVQPAVVQGGSQQPMMWMPMMPAAGMQMPYWAPPPGMVWPYQAPVMMPSPLYPAWRPVMLLMVPMPVPATGGVDYGPVADTPVVFLPQADGGADAAPAAADLPSVKADEAAGPQSGLPEAVPAASVDEAPAAATPVVDLGGVQPSPAVALIAPLTGVTLEEAGSASAVQAAEAPASVAMVDYGPVAPTPIVDLEVLLLQQPAVVVPEPAATVPATLPKVAPKPIRKKAKKVQAKPAKKRMCWSNGVVAPCR
ncbi:MAG: hypothetical protein R6W97_06940 [Thiobacillus sp.]